MIGSVEIAHSHYLIDKAEKRCAFQRGVVARFEIDRRDEVSLGLADQILGVMERRLALVQRRHQRLLEEATWLPFQVDGR